MTQPIDLGKRYHAIGFNVFPVDDTKRPPIRGYAANGDELRYSWGAWKQQRQAITDLDSMPWDKAAGVMGICGPGGYRCVDFDDVTDPWLITAFLNALHLPNNYKWTVRTPGKLRADGTRNPGYHVWVHCPDLKMDKGKLDLSATFGADHVELRAYDHYTLLPGSAHPDGGVYEFLNEDPSDAPATVDADRLLTAYRMVTLQPAQKAVPAAQPQRASHVGGSGRGHNPTFVNGAIRKELDDLAATKSGRNNQLNTSAYKLGGYLHANVVTEAELTELLYQAATANGYVAKRGEAAARATIRSGLSSGKANPRDVPDPNIAVGIPINMANNNGAAPSIAPPPAATPPNNNGQHTGSTAAPKPTLTIHNTDMGNARRLVMAHGGNIRYVIDLEKWIYWNGRYWKEDTSRHIEWLAKDVVTGMYAQAKNIIDDDERKRFIGWVLQSENQTRINAMVRSAQSERGITITSKELNSNPWIINVSNGTIDLKTGKLLPHRQDDMNTHCIDIDYDPQAESPLWRDFLNRIQNSDADTIDFIHRAMGYTLIGTVKEEAWIFAHGDGRNGKSVFMETFVALLGSYAVRLPMMTLQQREQGSRTRNDIARLRGARLVIASEVEADRRLNESLIKDLTGGDTLHGNQVFKDGFDFAPSHTLWMYGNHKPVIRGTDKGIWRRVRFVPFSVTIPENEVDTSLKDKLKAELQGILTWVVQGCLEWQKRGLQPSGAMLAAATQYQADMDTIGRFIADDCVTGINPRTLAPYEGKVTDIYKAYESWCEDNKEYAISKRKFGDDLERRGFARGQNSTKTARIHVGIAVQAIVAVTP